MYFMGCGELNRIKGSRSNNRKENFRLALHIVYLKYTTIFPEDRPDPRYITWGLIQDPFYKEPEGRIDISEMYTTWITYRKM